MYAKVIVDIATGQTNRAFDYEIPASLEMLARPGSRVTVPFGARKIQGFIWRIEEKTELARVKPITDVLDPHPVLTQELLELGEYLAVETVCFLITAYQSMIPAAIRAKPKKKIELLVSVETLPPVLQAVFQKQTTVDWKDLPDEKAVMQHVQEAVRHEQIRIDYQVKDQTKKQTRRMLRLHPEHRAHAASLTAKAKKQLELYDWFLSIGDEEAAVPAAQLLHEQTASRAVIQGLVEKNILMERHQESYRDPFEDRSFETTPPQELTHDQQRALAPITEKASRQQHHTFLLHGVTGSGKTEVYLQAIDRVLQQEREAIVLVPEISLTPQMVERFKGRFGDQVAVMHSALSRGERYDEWRRVHAGDAKVAVGARSAIFAPFKNVGLIIIDEEHEGSYKQEDHPRYHAREIAIWRGRYHGAPVVLGSATPSLESYARAGREVYQLLEMPERINQKQLPAIDVVDMRDELHKGNRSVFSETLLEKLKDRLEKGEQSILFLNRRGYSSFVMCRSCGYTAECPHCEITLTYHQTKHQLKCHYCGYEEAMPSTCPSCESEQIRYFGTGTQKVEEELTKVLPEARIIRMDMDTTTKKGSHEQMLRRFGNGEADILLGTQMIAKGLDFPMITLVGVLAADTMLHLPDFRAPERTFQLLTQVSGRAGRDKLQGEVVIQSYSPDHYSIQFAKNHDYPSFSRHEMGQRKRGGYPPYYYLTMVNVSHEEIGVALKTAEKVTSRLREELSPQAKILGPTVSPIARIKDRYRYQCMIKYRDEPELTKILNDIAVHYQKETAQDKLFITIDMYPQLFL